VTEWTADRARSFGRVAAEYENGRPEYPREAVAWLLEAAPDGTVVDLGAGTGKLTRGLVGLRPDVVAIEPLDELRQILKTAVPGIDTISGTAEAIPLADESAAAVTVGQAFHWFDLELTLPEIARVLIPGGVMGVIWNLMDKSVPWIHDLAVILGTEGPSWSDRWLGKMPEVECSPLFEVVGFSTFRHVPNLTVEALLDRASSVSRIALLTDAEREAVREQVMILLSSHPDTCGHEQIAFPQIASAFRAQRCG
jgi:SAM-dependent methyltransferase